MRALADLKGQIDERDDNGYRSHELPKVPQQLRRRHEIHKFSLTEICSGLTWNLRVSEGVLWVRSGHHGLYPGMSTLGQDAEAPGHDLLRLSGELFVTVNDALALRAAGLLHDRDGYTKNLAAGWRRVTVLHASLQL